MMLDYSTEYDTTKVDIPENYMAMHKLLDAYTRIEVKEGHTLQPDSVDNLIRLYLRVLADYSDPDLSTAAGLEKALAFSIEPDSQYTHHLSVMNHIRYAGIVYISSDPGIHGDMITHKTHEGKEFVMLYTRSKWIDKSLPRWIHWHRTDIYDILDSCDSQEIPYFTINNSYNKVLYNVRWAREDVDELDAADDFWTNIRQAGVEREYLFPLLAQDFLYRDVGCAYGKGKTVMGRATPYQSGQAPGYNIRTPGGRTVYVPLNEIVEICELTDEMKQHISKGN
ncbi:MAG: hypothetical protein LUD51_05665 [Clostridia bacterium]|nr:hypothetical protein [Clostridia bacterium]